MSVKKFASTFSTAYLTALPRVLYRTTASSLLDPKGSLQFCHEVLNARDVNSDDPVLGSVVANELIPGGGDIVIQGPFYTSSTGGTGILMELASLAYTVKVLSPKSIFEIGTFLGRTTRLFSMNAPDAHVYTLDLPQGKVPHDKKLGRDFLDTPQAARITQLTGDSTKFDYSPYYQSADFVWVDANHEYDFMVNDTAAAFKICKPGGWIGWHDYRHTAWWSGVTRHIREIKDRFKVIKHIRGTTVVLARFDG